MVSLLYSIVKKYIKNKHLLHLKKNMFANAIIGEHFETLIGAMIINESGEKSRIKIGHHCRINGLITSTRTGNVEIGCYSTVQVGARICSAQNIKIGNYTGIAENAVVFDNNTHSTEIASWVEHRIRVAPKGIGYPGLGYGWECAESAPVVIGDGVWIGGDSSIMKGVCIGDGAIVARSSVVTKDVEPFTIVAGNPARVVRRLQHPNKSVGELAEEILEKYAI